MKVHFLGTNGWYDTATGNTVCTLIECREFFLVLDAGGGIYKLDSFIKNKKPIYLFISHFHLDHVIGLHILNKFKFKQGLHIFGYQGAKKLLHRLICKDFTAPFNKLKFKVDIQELNEGKYKMPFEFECKFLVHTTKCLGYKFSIENKMVTYCTDTEYCKNAIYLAKNADLLISECSYKPGQINKWSHLNPEKAARIASIAEAKKLALTHFDASHYKNIYNRIAARAAAKRIFKNTILGVDNLSFNI